MIRIRPWLLAAVSLSCAASSAPPRAAEPPGPPYLRELVARARQQGLADARDWHVLLHYRRNRLGRAVTSLADSPGFFLAPAGQTDPSAELEATLAAFFAPGVGDGHPQCRFPARHRWLAERLEIDPRRLSPRTCPALEEWLAGLDANAVTLVFAESYMNNPPSMFGHTLLRIDALPYDSDQRRRDLLAYAVNFAAQSGPDGGPLFAVKGIAGLYPGYFSVEPYYDKVKKYSDWESRDLWEYQLDFRPDEVDRMLRHLWELRDVAFYYYFFDENCSYELLGLIEAGRPGLDLMGRFPAWVIPVDTVRAVVEEAGLSEQIRWRPSAAARLRHLADPLSAEERGLSLAVANGELEPDDARIEALAVPARARVLTLAHDHLRLQAESGEGRETRERALRILTARSRVPASGEPGPPAARPAVRPEEGHETARLVLGSGFRDGRFFWEARLRPAFHDLLDPQGGYSEGAQIDFMQGTLRYYPDGNELTLHEVTLVDIQSVSPRDAFFQPVSWKFRTGLTSRLLPGGSDRTRLRNGKLWRSHGGAGLAVRPWSGALAYAFLDGTLDFSGKLDPEWALGAGSTLGFLWGDAQDRFRLHLRGEATRFLAGDTRTFLSLALEPRWRVGRSAAIGLRLAVERDFHESWLDAGLFWSHFF